MSKSIEAIREALAVAQGILNDPSSTSTHLFQAHESFRETATLLAIAELLAAHDAALSRASEVEAERDILRERADFLLSQTRETQRLGAFYSDGWMRAIRALHDIKHAKTTSDAGDIADAAIRSMRPTGDSGVAG